MKKLISLIVLTMSMSQIAFASGRCLQNVSDEELLSEVAYRMRLSTDRPEDSDVQVSFLCGTGLGLQIRVTNLKTGSEQMVEDYIGSNCPSYRNKLSSLFPNGRVERSQMFAFCNNSANLIRYAVNTEAQLTRLGETYMGHGCDKAASDINGR